MMLPNGITGFYGSGAHKPPQIDGPLLNKYAILHYHVMAEK